MSDRGEQEAPAVEWGVLLRDAGRRLAAAGVDSPRVDAELLLAHVLGTGRGEAVARAFAGVRADAEAAARYAALVQRRSAREPLQHVTGTASFHGLELAVGPGVFVPRPETEVLVEAGIAALERMDEADPAEPLRVVDLCTGSGAVAAAVAAWARGSGRAVAVTAVELDPTAHAWARRNLEPWGVDLRQADALVAAEDLRGLVDVVLSNPPYVPDAELPTQAEARLDPALALYGGDAAGTRIPFAIARRAAALLRPGGFFCMEHHETQGTVLAAALTASGAFEHLRVLPDLTGRARFTTGTRTAAAGAAEVGEWPA